MIILLSPAKTLDFDPVAHVKTCTKPDLLEFSEQLINGLGKLSVKEIGSLMRLSPKLAELNHERFQNWKAKHDLPRAKQAVLAFKGDVYSGLSAWDFNKEDFQFAQENLRILSGLYGILRPLDLIQPYRLEMGTVYPNPAGKDLYAFWGDRLRDTLSNELSKSGSDLIINLASLEYAKAARLNTVGGKVVSPVFQDEKNGKFKVISFYAKKARGLMARHLIQARASSLSDLLNFKLDGYEYCPKESSEYLPVFKRPNIQRAIA